MMSKLVTPQLLFDLGLLHDCKINQLSIDGNILSIQLDDIYANTFGMPEYPGRQAARVVIEFFESIEPAEADLRAIGLPAQIYEMEINNVVDCVLGVQMVLKLWPEGNFCFCIRGASIIF